MIILGIGLLTAFFCNVKFIKVFLRKSRTSLQFSGFTKIFRLVIIRIKYFVEWLTKMKISLKFKDRKSCCFWEFGLHANVFWPSTFRSWKKIVKSHFLLINRIIWGKRLAIFWNWRLNILWWNFILLNYSNFSMWLHINNN